MGKTYRRSSDGYGFSSPKSLREKRSYGNKVRKNWDSVSDYERPFNSSTTPKQLPADDRGEW